LTDPRSDPRFRSEDVTEAPVAQDADALRAELQTHRDLLATFETKGWAAIAAVVAQQRTTAYGVLKAITATSEAVQIARGELIITDYLLGLPEYHAKAAALCQQRLAELAAEEGDE